ncbi:MAG TPA: GGDEF domain-containing protein [Magnetospirillaceae bacterium]|nr:GGDEF domain-containing protein [Magnetospirillaceae bacterium]
MVEQEGRDGDRKASEALDLYRALESSGALVALEALRKENREFDSLVNDAACLMVLQDVSDMLDFAISRFLDRFIPSFLAFLIEPPRGNRLRQYCYRSLRLCDEEIPIQYYRTLKGLFQADPRPRAVSEIREVMGGSDLGRDFDSYETEYILPMRGIEGHYGIILLGRKIAGGEYTVPERMYLDRFSRFLAIGIQNSLHHESALTDPKTGLFNHDYFMRRVEEELARSVRRGSRAGIILADVDHFKRFNDRYGHLAGDEVLLFLARLLKAAIRSEDTAARFGGEEFSVLVMECDESHLLEIAERIRSAVEGLRVPYKGRSLSVTISLGIRMLDARAERGVRGLLEEADRALYASKAAGRNRVTVSRPGLLGKASILRLLQGTRD